MLVLELLMSKLSRKPEKPEKTKEASWEEAKTIEKTKKNKKNQRSWGNQLRLGPGLAWPQSKLVSPGSLFFLFFFVFSMVLTTSQLASLVFFGFFGFLDGFAHLQLRIQRLPRMCHMAYNLTIDPSDKYHPSRTLAFLTMAISS